MGGLSIWHWLVLGAVVLLLFGGRGKISGMMGDLAGGIKAFKRGMKEDDEPATAAPAAPQQVPGQAANTAQAQTPPQPQAAPAGGASQQARS